MAKLQTINLPDAADKKGRKTIPTVLVPSPEGDLVQRYNQARDQKDRAEATLKELAPTLQEVGLKAVFERNCAAESVKDVISSVNLADQSQGDHAAGKNWPANEEVLMLSWLKKDLKNDPMQVEAEFNALRTIQGKKPNVNNYVVFEPVASFDASVFMVNGKFSQERYDAFMEVLNEVSNELGVANPLSCASVLKPIPDFHEAIRWQQFDLEANLAIHKVLPTQVNLKPVRENGKAA